MATEKRFGRQTPTQSFVLDYDRSLYSEAVRLYESSGNSMYDWQKKLLRDIMAIDGEQLWTHSKVGYSVPRRNGKTEVVYAREIYGLMKGEQICHTAHRTSTSHSSFEKTKKLLEKAGIEFESKQARGAEVIEIPETGGKIQYRTRTGSGGLGEGFDLLVIDEAQEYTDDQRTALVYTVTDSPNPQTIMCGTPPTNVSKGTVFPKFRTSALSGKAKNSLWAEWSVDQMSDVQDRELWYLTNPSMGYHLNERKIEDEISTDLADFNVQRLGLWLTYSQSSAISRVSWDALKVSELPNFKGRLFAGIKYGKTPGNVSLSVAVRTDDGHVFVEALDCRPAHQGNAWLIAFMQQADLESVVIDGASGQQVLVQDMKDARIRLKPVLPRVQDVIDAGSVFETGLFSSSIRHAGQPSLTASVTNCDKRAIGSNGGFGYKSQKPDIDITLMESMMLAYWACATAKPRKKQRIRC